MFTPPQMLKYRLTGSDNAYVYEYPGGETFDLYVDIISSAGYVYEVVYDADGDADKYTETTFFYNVYAVSGSYYINEGLIITGTAPVAYSHGDHMSFLAMMLRLRMLFTDMKAVLHTFT